MFRRSFHRSVSRLEKSFDYDAAYLHEIVDASPWAFIKFGLFQVMSAHRRKVPRNAWYAARIAATLHEDCGPCTQISVDLALRDRVKPAVLAALLRRDWTEAGPDAAFGFRYGAAVAANAPDAPELAAEALRLYGRQGQVSLAYGVACARVYPTLKRGLGHGAACARIRVSGEDIAVGKTA
jgi:hypothetical protein